MYEQICFVSVRSLKNFVANEARRIESRRFTLRSIRQLTDARRFLDMLENPRYSYILKVDDLKRAFTKERNRLQEISELFNKLLLDYEARQLEGTMSITLEQLNYLKAQKIILDEEIHWLHKCLGICHNKEYFR